MRVDRRHLGPMGMATVAAAMTVAGIWVAPQAAADCVSVGATTICGQGTVTGSGAAGPIAQSTMPDACALDPLCATAPDAGRPDYPKQKKGPS